MGGARCAADRRPRVGMSCQSMTHHRAVVARAGARQTARDRFALPRHRETTIQHNGHVPHAEETTWTDAQLIAAVRRDPPDDAALQALVDRYWKMLYSRCLMLVQNADAAADLAQDTWLRLLKARRSLRPDGNLPAYLTTIATNVWRDQSRAARRAGPMAESRLASLDRSDAADPDAGLRLADVLPDPATLDGDEQLQLQIDIDHALGRLRPHLRDVLVARYLGGESSAEIGVRYDRTEQSISGWIRQALREMERHLRESRHGTGDESRV